MHFKPVFRSIAAVALLLVATEGRATPFYNDVDSVTLPGGPISLVPGTVSNVGDVYTLTGTIENSSSLPVANVDYVSEFVFDTTSTAPATDMPFSAGVWSDAVPNTFSVNSPSGTLLMSDTNLPLSSGAAYDGATGMLMSSDEVPFMSFGTIPGMGSVPFSETVTSSTDHFTLRGSFVSAPEPSTLVLFGAGAIGALFFFGQRRRSTAILASIKQAT